MATGGEVPGTKVQHSDAVHEYTCFPCSQNDVTTEATHYCPECDVCYCKACLCDHAVLGRSKIDQWGKTEDTRDNAKAVEQEDTCLRHPGHTVTLYCEYHDVLCCPLCSYTDHRSCKKLAKIRAAAVKDNISVSVKKVEDEIANLEINTETLAKHREVSKRFLERSYTNYVQQLSEMQDKVNAKFEAVKEDARNRKQHNMEKFSTDKQFCESITEKLTGLKQTLSPTNDIPESFIKVKRSGEWVRNTHEALKSMLNATVTDVFTNIAHVDESRTLRSLTHVIDVKIDEKKFLIETREDDNECEIAGICQIANSHIILADKANKCLKQLDKAYSVISRCKLQAIPQCVCAAGDSEVAVAIDNRKILIVAVGTAFKTTRVLAFDHPCTYVTTHNDQVFITNNPPCTRNCLQCQCKTKIHIYDKSGNAFRTMTADIGEHKKDFGTYKTVDEPVPMCISEGGDKLYVAHRYGLAVLDSHGRSITSTQDYEYTSIAGLCVDNNECVYASNRRSSRVVKFSQEGTGGFERVQTVTSSLKVSSPGAICYDKRLGFIVICQEKGSYLYLEKLEY